MAVNIGPKIGIDGEAEYRKELNNLIQATKTFKSEMEAMTSAFDKNGSKLKQNKEQHKALKEQQAALKKEVESLKNMVEKSTAQYGEADTKTLKWKDALAKAETELNNLNKELANTAPLKGFAEDMETAADSLNKVGSAITGAGKTLTASVTAPIVAAGTASVTTAADFESSMNKVAAISGATGDDLTALSDKAKKMGATTKYSASESADAMSYMAMAGWKTEDMLGGIEGIMSLAAASGEDLATISDIVTDALTAFGMQASDSGHFADVLAAASSNANTNVSMMGETFKYAAPIAGALGYSVEDTAEAIGLMANAGIKSSQAGTSLRTIMTSLQGEVKICGEELGDVAIQTTNADGSMRDFSDILADCRTAFDGLSDSEKASTAEALVGKNAMSGFLALMSASESDISKLSGAIDNADGTAASMAQTMESGLNGQITVLKSSIEGLAITFGEKLQPTVEKVVEFVQQLTDKLNSMNSEQVEAIIKIAAVAAVVGPVLIVVGSLITAIGSIIGAIGAVSGVIGTFTGLMAAGSTVGAALVGTFGAINLAIVGVVAGIAVAIAAGVYLYKHVDDIKAFLSEACASIAEGWNIMCGKIKSFNENIAKGISEKWNAIKTAVSDKVASIKTTVSEKWNAIKTDITTKVDNIKSSVTSKFDAIKTGITDKINSAKEAVRSAVDKIKGFFNFSWSLPKLKLPHFSISGSFSLNPPSVPKLGISWYKKAYSGAYALDGAQIFGAMGGSLLGGGEGSGREIILGENYLQESLVNAVQKAFGYIPNAGNTYGDTTINVYGAPGQDVRELADIIEQRIAANVRRRSGAW